MASVNFLLCISPVFIMLMPVKNLLLMCLIAYLAGSINFAIIFFKLAGKADPRLSFSGNAGTTNVYRQAGMLWASVVLVLDIGRAVAVAALAIQFAATPYIPWAGFFLILGNSYPCFHKFHGGKGVANYLGFSVLVAPWSAFVGAMAWVAAHWIYRIPFVASLFMIFILAVGHDNFSFNWTVGGVTGAAATFLLILFNHRGNIIEFRERNK
jgi:glycerol-3-phosphate acyltransferase PlsY